MTNDPPRSPTNFRGWPETEPEWPFPIGQHWAYSGVIHESPTAHLTIWTYHPPNLRTGTRRLPPPHVTTLALKTTHHPSPRRGGYPPSYNGPRTEGSFLSLLSLTRSPHIIQQYGPPRSDSQKHEVLFLEYVPSIDGILGHNNLELLMGSDCEPLAEVDVWGIFAQFVKMVNVMDRGDDDVSVQRWDRGEIWHCDINLRNVLMGARSSEYDRCPVLKLCDFADALEIPRLEDQDDSGWLSAENGQYGFRPPEQFNPESLDHVRHGTCSNIFSLGHLIYLLMFQRTRHEHLILPGHNPAKIPGVLGNRRLRNLDGHETYGWKLMPRHISHVFVVAQYSEELRELVMECMMREPLLRPRPEELQNRVQMGLARAREKMPEGLPMHSVFARVGVQGAERGPDPRWLESAGGPELVVRQWVPKSEELEEDDDSGGGNEYEEGMKEDAGISHLPMRERNAPGTVGRGLALMEYFERIGRMPMGEDSYYRILEAGLDPEEWTPRMAIPNPDDDADISSLPEDRVVMVIDSDDEEREVRDSQEDLG
ncbi:hypothetical protein ACMFMG_002065 [Clarireedia jacksonii]